MNLKSHLQTEQPANQLGRCHRHRTRLLPSALVMALTALATPLSATATVEALTTYNIVTEDVQSGDLCFLKMPAYAEYGIGGLPEALLSVKPVFLPRVASAGPSQVQANQIAAWGGASVEFVDLGFEEEDIQVYRFSVDLSAAHAQNGSSLAGRARTISVAKLALLAINKNLHEIWPDKYKLFVTFKNLPSQNGISGTTLNSTTNWSYTNNSPLIAAYTTELINTQGFCR